MPKSDAVWGIDIGQCGLKAMRCEADESTPQRIIATAFDFIEYPQILSQPEAEPALLVREALNTFLSRNTVRADHVAISVSGQSGLARFIKLPPVESKKIPDIVKYEARQQIPFSLDDVVWDYQQMSGGSVDEGFALETEVGLFAMKRDQVFRALAPLDDVGIEVDYIQLAPLAVYNMVVFDQLRDLPTPDEYDPEDPPESVVILSMGTDNTDLVVTNGYRLWQRNVPLGGNHFTKALSKELKLTFAKAEHLKRNAADAEDPKQVFQAMRPVFNDLLTEVQRSLGYFGSIDRKAKIQKVIGLGNAMKLPGLQRYLSQNLGYEVETLEAYNGLAGPAVVAAPAFKENIFSFGDCYGLCVQGLEKSALRTNLIPPELITDRIIRDKKPWAVIAMAILLVGCTLNFLGHWAAWSSAHPTKYADATQVTSAEKRRSDELNRDFTALDDEYKMLNQVGENLVSNVEGRLLWLEVIRVIDAALPAEPRPEGEDAEPKPISQRRELHITSFDCERLEDLAPWRQGIAAKYAGDQKAIAAGPGAAAAAAADAALAAEAAATEPDGAPPPAEEPAAAGEEEAEDPGPTGAGWVIELQGYHYYNDRRIEAGATFVRETLLKNLSEGTVDLPIGPNGDLRPVRMKDLGVLYPVIVEGSRIVREEIAKPEKAPELGGPMGLPAAGPGALEGGEAEDAVIEVKRFDFVVQFCWQPTPPSVRTEKSQLEAEAGAATGSTTPVPGGATAPAGG
jgi:type IV pilus assembly protein PilM